VPTRMDLSRLIEPKEPRNKVVSLTDDIYFEKSA